MEIYYIDFIISLPGLSCADWPWFPAFRLNCPIDPVGCFCRASRPHHRLFPVLLGLFQKYTAKVPVCLLKMQFSHRSWAYIKFVGEKSLSFAKYVGLCRDKARGSSNEPPLALRLLYIPQYFFIYSSASFSDK